MKWYEKWGAAIAVILTVCLASCGTGNDDRDKPNTLSTQSPPPAAQTDLTAVELNNSADTASGLRTGSAVARSSATSGNTSATENAGSKSGTTRLTYTDRATTVSPRTSKKKSTKTAMRSTYHPGSGATDRSSSKLGDSSTMPNLGIISSDSTGGKPWVSTKDFNLIQPDSSRNISTPDTGIIFTSKLFVPDQIRSNYAEIKMARMAIDKSQNDEVKQVARTLEDDHNNLLRELLVMARNPVSGTDSIPTSENDMARQHMDMMRNLSGQEFDRQWLQHMHMMHDQEIQMFEQAVSHNSIQDAELRIWVEKTLPVLRKHREMLAQTLNSINK